MTTANRTQTGKSMRTGKTTPMTGKTPNWGNAIKKEVKGVNGKMNGKAEKYPIIPSSWAKNPNWVDYETEMVLDISADDLQDVAALFDKITNWTCPNPFEKIMWDKALTGLGFQTDEWGNYYSYVGIDPKVMFVSHLDTADSGLPKKIEKTVINQKMKTDGKTLLGADDRTGVAIILYMWSQGVEGLYYLFLGEERGCIGSSKAASDRFKVDAVISFDRRGYDSVITRQIGKRTASDEFAQALADALNLRGLEFKPDPTGSYTDSNEFADFVAECTNLSVGYKGAHTSQEVQDIGFMEILAYACADIDWEELPIIRDPKEHDDDYGGYGGYTFYHAGTGKRGNTNYKSIHSQPLEYPWGDDYGADVDVDEYEQSDAEDGRSHINSEVVQLLEKVGSDMWSRKGPDWADLWELAWLDDTFMKYVVKDMIMSHRLEFEDLVQRYYDIDLKF